MKETENEKTAIYGDAYDAKEEDQFGRAILGVKKAFREDPNKGENAIFLNKMNYVCRNYENTH